MAWIGSGSTAEQVTTEHHLVVRKTARYCLLGEIGAATTDLWIVCHGFGQLAREFIPVFEPIAKPGRAIVAPEALNRFYKSQGTLHTPESPVGATWMTTEDRETEIADYIAYLDALLDDLRPKISREAKVTALGFSQGVATISRWVAASGPSLSQVIFWGGLLPPEFKDQRSLSGLSSQPLAFVVGNADRYFSNPLVDSEVKRLEGLGIPVLLTRFDGGHVVDPETLRSLAGRN